MPLTVTHTVLTITGTPVANSVVTARPTINPLFENIGGVWYIVQYGGLSATTDNNGTFTLSLPWPSACDPSSVQWVISIPDGTHWGGTVPDGVSGPVSIKTLKDSYGWGLVSATGLTPIVTVQGPPGAGGGGGGSVATTIALGTTKVDNNSGGNPVALTQAGLQSNTPLPDSSSGLPGVAVVPARWDHSHPRSSPLAHEATHLPGGADTIDWLGTVHAAGTLGARPAASAANAGCYYFASDASGGTLYRSTGSAWTPMTVGLTAPPQVHASTHLPSGSDPIAWGSVLQSGTSASRPAASPSNANCLYFATDTNVVYQSTGATWTTVCTGGSGSVGVATASSLGAIQLDQNPASGNPLALTVPRLGAASGVCDLDAGTHVPLTRLSGITASQLASSAGITAAQLASIPGHEASHLPGGADAIDWNGTIHPAGTLAARPAAAASNRGAQYLATDDGGGTMYRSDGATWTKVSPGVTAAPQSHEATHLPGGADAFPWATVVNLSGTDAARPAASSANAGLLYHATDTNKVYKSDGSTWAQVLNGGAGGTGMTDPETTAGDMIYRNASNVTARLPVGAIGSRLEAQVTAVGGSTVEPTWMTESYNVKAFGAKGDGSTDDTAAIRNAIAAAVAAGGGRVYFPSATYVIKVGNNTTTLAAPATNYNAGTTSWNFTSTTGFSVGQNFVLGSGATYDLLQIQSITGNTVVTTAGSGSVHSQGNTVYGLNPIIVSSNLLLEGDGPTSIIKIGNAVGDFTFAFTSANTNTNVNNLWVRRLAFDSNIANNTYAPASNSATMGIGFQIFQGSNFWVSDCLFTWHGANTVVWSGGTSLLGGKCINNSFTWNKAPGAADYDNTVVYFDTADAVIANNRFITTVAAGTGGRGGIELHGGRITCTGNTINGFRTAIEANQRPNSEGTVTIADNTVYNANWGVRVDPMPAANDPTALSFAITGNALSIANVTHNQVSCAAVSIDAGSSTTGVVQGMTVSNNTIMFQDEGGGRVYGFATNSPNNTVDPSEGTGIMLQAPGGASDCVIAGNVIINAPRAGIQIGSVGGSGIVKNVRVVDNLIRDAGSNIGFGYQKRCGIEFRATCTDCVIENNSIIDNQTQIPPFELAPSLDTGKTGASLIANSDYYFAYDYVTTSGRSVLSPISAKVAVGSTTSNPIKLQLIVSDTRLTNNAGSGGIGIYFYRTSTGGAAPTSASQMTRLLKSNLAFDTTNLWSYFSTTNEAGNSSPVNNFGFNNLGSASDYAAEFTLWLNNTTTTGTNTNTTTTSASTMGANRCVYSHANLSATLTNCVMRWPHLSSSDVALLENLPGSGIADFRADASGHLILGGPQPGASAGANAGTSPPAAYVPGYATDAHGLIEFGTGTVPAAGAMVVVTYHTAYASNEYPVPIITAQNLATANLGLYVSSYSNNGFTISSVNAPAASQGQATYQFGYIVGVGYA